MLDRERILGRLDALDGHLVELRGVVPLSLADYREVKTRRACERILQIAVESVLDVCGLLVGGLRLGLPGEEDDLFDKLEAASVLSSAMADTLRRMKGCRNILVHEYGHVNDELVFDTISSKLGDFARFKEEVLRALPGD